MKSNSLLMILSVVAVILTGVAVYGYWRANQDAQSVAAIDSFEDCAAAGYPIMESYPEQCATPDGRSFTRVIGPDDQTSSTPAPNGDGSDASPLPPGETVTVKGTVVCLPHKDTTGPQTLECAFGLQAEDGTYYALRDPSPTHDNVIKLPVGEVAVITGPFTPQTDTQYQSIGVIEIVTVEN